MTYLAIDFGGGSGRVIAGTLAHGVLSMEEIHRFPNRQVRLGNHLYWDFPALFAELKTGLKKASAKGLEVKGIGIDTWGVDFGLIDRNGDLIGNPVCYRDTRTQGLPEKYFQQTDRSQHYKVNGTQVMEINTLFQLMSLKESNSPQLEMAQHLLFTPDLFSYFLTGEVNNEYSIASTSELLDARTKDWDWATIDALGLPRKLFGRIVMPGEVRGHLRKELAEETGLGEVDVVAVGSHDTASAVAAVPAQPDERPVAFLSSGTWSLLGVELNEPMLTEEARLGGFTNEGGVGNRITFLQNITGLWILQRLMAEWKEAGEEQTFDVILPLAEQVRTDTIIDVDDPLFQNPPNMQRAIADYCRAKGLVPPAEKEAVVRVVLQSLACRYAQAVSRLNAMLPEPVRLLHVIGGGSQNKLLNRLTAEALQLPVVAGPVEATGMGNILVQAMAKGEISDMDAPQSFSHQIQGDVPVSSLLLEL